MNAQELQQKGLVEVSLSDLLFDVRMYDNPRQANNEYSKVVTGIIDGKEIDLNYCSPRYELVPNTEIFPVVERVLKSNNIDFTVHYYALNNARFYAEYTIENKEYAYNMSGTTDYIKPMLRVQHSYNGLTKYVINFGYYRLVCTNGLTIPVKEMKEFNLSIIGKHTESIKQSFLSLDRTLKYFAQNAKQVTTQITRKFEILRGQKVLKVNARIEDLLKKAGITAKDTSKFNTVDHIRSIVNAESKKLYNGEINNWLIYNGINSYIYDNDLNRKSPEVRQVTDSKVLELMLAE